jgi:hypothetical protein
MFRLSVLLRKRDADLARRKICDRDIQYSVAIQVPCGNTRNARLQRQRENSWRGREYPDRIMQSDLQRPIVKVRCDRIHAVDNVS